MQRARGLAVWYCLTTHVRMNTAILSEPMWPTICSNFGYPHCIVLHDKISARRPAVCSRSLAIGRLRPVLAKIALRHAARQQFGLERLDRSKQSPIAFVAGPFGAFGRGSAASLDCAAPLPNLPATEKRIGRWISESRRAGPFHCE